MTGDAPTLRAVAYPMSTDRRGAASTVTAEAALEQLIEELLFTSPGERLNRPLLGCGALGLVFDTLTDELATAARFQIQSSLQQWLGSLIAVASVQSTTAGGALEVTVTYQLRDAGRWRTAVFRR